MVDAKHPLRKLAAKLSDRAELSDTDREAIVALPFTTKAMTAGQHIIRAGQIPTSCTILLSGFAQRYRLVNDGGRQIVGFHMEGDFVDLHFSMLHGADQSVQLVTPAKLADIPVAAVLRLTRTRPAVAEALWIDSLADASVFQEWVVRIGRRDARARLAHLLCELALKQEHAGLGSRSEIHLPLTQEQLGDALGRSRPSTWCNWGVASGRIDQAAFGVICSGGVSSI
ncbi:Crp/Fnr family transcriptional regulator, partial [Sphingobium tyrosinilyticum]